MTKTYITPELVPQGSVAELTELTDERGVGDPKDPVIFAYASAGSVGFNL